MEILECKTNTGLLREKNEDYVIAISHPKSKKIKLLAVADGMGGREDGEKASAFVINSLENWFINKDIKTLNDTEKTLFLLKRYIKLVNGNMIKKFGENHLGTTLALALVNKKKTIIINIGDSRTYIYKDKCLEQITEDDSEVWYYYKCGEVIKDDLRFFATSNLINACIGLNKELCTITSKIINNDYEMLLLFSDGVTDLLTDKKIDRLIRKNKKEKLLDKIIYEAVYVEQYLFVPFRLKNKYLANYTIPYKGRDNASGAIYIKDV